MKSFLSRTDDKFRQAYGTVVESHPRTNIIVGSSNSDNGFLRDITGNRRFWPVDVTGLGKHHPWELTEVDQVWAEALNCYHAGEELYLKGDIAAEAYHRQLDAMESDDREGIIEEYLGRLLQQSGIAWISISAGASWAVANLTVALRSALCHVTVSASWRFGVNASARSARTSSAPTPMR